MGIKKGVELHVIISPADGVACVQIVGPTDTHPEGHDLYFRILDLVQEFDKKVQTRIAKSRDESPMMLAQRIELGKSDIEQ